MDINSEVYNTLNGAQVRDAQELLDQIKADNVERADLIVDVGSGSGNVTANLSKSLPHDRIVAFDIEDQMVEFARKQNETEPTVEFFVDDVSRPWDELNPILRELENKVDLVWSNRVLHWVREKDRGTAAANIARLLRPGGRFYTNITMFPDLNEFLPQEQREENEKVIKMPSWQEQEDSWRNLFQEAGLTNLTLEKLSKNWRYDDESSIGVERSTVHYFRRYISDDKTNEEKDAILENLGFPDIWVHTLFTPIGLPPNVDGAKDLTYYYQQLRITGVKPEA